MKISKSILNSETQKQAIDSFKENYYSRISELREDLHEDYENTELSCEFQSFYKEALNSNELDNYSSLNWYWLQLIEKLIYLLYLHDTLEISDGEFELSESEDELFNFWHDSEFTNTFLQMLNENKDLKKTSSFHLSFLESQIMTVFCLHIDSSIEINEKQYFTIPEIGDSDSRISTPNGFYTFEETKTILISTKSHRVNINGKEGKLKPFKIIDASVISSDEKIDQSIEDIKTNINKALEIIKFVSPELFNTFSNFTKHIVPINEPGIVSYSMQILPSYSSINTFERDFLDLLDDLLHENGHHYMNAFLNDDELVINDDEKIYYSPWRKALRPIRGIYHAYFTFFWALKLYSCLYDSRDKLRDNYGFDDEKIFKIHKRLCEEYYMLIACHNSIEDGYNTSKINDNGYELYKKVRHEIEQIQPMIEPCLKELKKISLNDYETVNKFIEELDNKIKHYSQEY